MSNVIRIGPPMALPQRFRTRVAQDPKGRVLIPVPFDPDDVWGRKVRHHVTGTVGGTRVRGTLTPRTPGGFAIVLGKAWARDCGLSPGDPVSVVIAPEGPQRNELGPDLAAALEAEPSAGEFFDSLAQFYRKAYLRWIDATKRRPEVRAQRIAEVVELLKRGEKQQPGK